MTIPWALVTSFVLGLFMLYLIGWLLLVPMKFLWRLMAGGLLGALSLWVVNQFGALTGFTVPLNPFTALSVGLLGLPGAVLIVGLQWLL